MNPPGLRKWTLGIQSLLIIVAILFAFVLYKGISGRHDRQTYQAATSIADKLNSYTDSNFKAPSSLQAAGVPDAPSTITYSKISNDSYKFCAAYKSSNKDVTSTVQNDLSAATSGGFGSNSGGSGNFGYSYGSSQQYDLSLDPNYHSGENCVTVSSLSNSLDQSNSGYSGSSSTDSSGGSTTDPYAKCDSIQDDAAWQQCLDSASKQEAQQQQQKAANSGTITD